MNFSVIQKSRLESAQRLDAEYYQPEYFIDFSKGSWVPIGSSLQLCQYGISQAMNEEKIGSPIFRMDDIKGGFLIDDCLKYVDIPVSLFKEYELQLDDILFNRVNSEEFVGRTGIYKLNGNTVFASYLIRLRVKNESGILPDYLNIFLNSSFGQKQIRKYRRRAVNQANVNAEELKEIKIAILPQTFQKEISQLAVGSWSNHELSKNYYQRAENFLLEELGLKDFKPTGDLSFVVNFSDLKSTNRIDSDFFQPKYEQLESQLRKYGSKNLREIVDNVPAIFDPITQANNMFNYVELADINSAAGTVEGSTPVAGKEAPGRAKRVLKSGDVIASSIEGSLEKVALADKEQEGYLASTGFFQFRSENILPEVLLVLAQSLVFQMQLQQRTTGTILSAVPKEDIKSVLVPQIPKETQQKIADLVRQSHEARKKSKELLEQAKRKVEEMIEKGGEENAKESN